FHTPDLNLENSQVIWIQEEGGTAAALPRVDLFFNYPIDPADLKDKLDIEIEGKKADVTPITVSADNKISVRINGLKQEDKDLAAKISIDKGLKPQGGGNSTKEPITASLSIPSPYVLQIQNITSEHDGV